MVGSIAVPIQNTEVFLFQMDVDGDGTPENLFWAHVDGGSTFLWYTGPITCGDGSVDGAGNFLIEVKAAGTGTFLFSLPNCPAGDLYGCDFDGDGNPTTCGACAVQGPDLACAVSG
jgi:hypothetical protein